MNSRPFRRDLNDAIIVALSVFIRGDRPPSFISNRNPFGPVSLEGDGTVDEKVK